MKLLLTPKGTLWPSLVMASMAVIALPVTLIFVTQRIDGQLWGRPGALPSMGAVALSLFLVGCFGPLTTPGRFPIWARATEFEMSLPITRWRLLMERSVRLWLALVVPVLVAVLLMGAAQVMGLSIWETAYDRAWSTSLFLWPPVLAVLGHGALAFTCVLAFEALRGRSQRMNERVRPVPAKESPERPWRRGQSQTTRVLLRSTLLRPRVVLSLVAFMALTAFSILKDFESGMLLAICLLMTMTMPAMVVNVLEGTDPLPISRTRVFPWIVGPTLGLVLFCFMATGLFPAEPLYREGQPLNEISLAWDYGADDAVVEVPPRLWRVAGASVESLATSPWGESSEPGEVRFLGRPTGIFHPYTVGADNTVRFARWQMSRAAAASGRELSPLEIERSVLPGSDPESLLRDARSALHGDPSVELLPLPWYRRMVGLKLVLAVLAWGFLSRVALRSRKPQRGAAGLMQTPFAKTVGMAWAVILLMLLPSLAPAWALTSYHVAEFWIDRQLGGSSLAWYGLTLALIVLMYLWNLRAFRRTETPPPMNASWGQRPMPIY